MLAVARTLIARDLLLAWRRRADVGVALLFFVIVASLFPLGVGAEPNQLRAIAPGVIWVAALLSALLLLGTPVLSFIGGIGAALTLGLRGGGVLLALLILPLYVPVLVLGAGAVDAASAGLAATGQLLALVAFLIVAAVFAPWAAAIALRVSVE